ncbi:MAG: PIN domain-containing protein [Chloroflexi bacterium]|nr:PIN domain-containing protein [Chloroflexota bacterium]
MSEHTPDLASYLLDTTVLIDYLRGHTEVRARFHVLAERGHELGICAISVAEVFAGLREKDREAAAILLSTLKYFDLSFDVALAAGAFQYTFARQGRTLKLTDVLIGAAALANNAILLTDNVKDFPLPGLQVERLPSGR